MATPHAQAAPTWPRSRQLPPLSLMTAPSPEAPSPAPARGKGGGDHSTATGERITCMRRVCTMPDQPEHLQSACTSSPQCLPCACMPPAQPQCRQPLQPRVHAGAAAAEHPSQTKAAHDDGVQAARTGGTLAPASLALPVARSVLPPSCLALPLGCWRIACDHDESWKYEHQHLAR